MLKIEFLSKTNNILNYDTSPSHPPFICARKGQQKDNRERALCVLSFSMITPRPSLSKFCIVQFFI